MAISQTSRYDGESKKPHGTLADREHRDFSFLHEFFSTDVMLEQRRDCIEHAGQHGTNEYVRICTRVLQTEKGRELFDKMIGLYAGVERLREGFKALGSVLTRGLPLENPLSGKGIEATAPGELRAVPGSRVPRGMDAAVYHPEVALYRMTKLVESARELSSSTKPSRGFAVGTTGYLGGATPSKGMRRDDPLLKELLALREKDRWVKTFYSDLHVLLDAFDAEAGKKAPPSAGLPLPEQQEIASRLGLVFAGDHLDYGCHVPSDNTLQAFSKQGLRQSILEKLGTPELRYIFTVVAEAGKQKQGKSTRTPPVGGALEEDVALIKKVLSALENEGNTSEEHKDTFESLKTELGRDLGERVLRMYEAAHPGSSAGDETVLAQATHYASWQADFSADMNLFFGCLGLASDEEGKTDRPVLAGVPDRLISALPKLEGDEPVLEFAAFEPLLAETYQKGLLGNIKTQTARAVVGIMLDLAQVPYAIRDRLKRKK